MSKILTTHIERFNQSLTGRVPWNRCVLHVCARACAHRLRTAGPWCAAVGTPEHEELPDHGQAIANAAVKEAVEKGVSYFDCAPGYWDFRGMERLGPVRTPMLLPRRQGRQELTLWGAGAGAIPEPGLRRLQNRQA